ncbi:MAG TPA: kynureninase, partial [Bacteroidetes bacterium]|nr:kynureninase [Bacteroidota bacterium]
MSDPLLKWREEFQILARTTYLISNSLGAMPRGVYDRLRRYAETWSMKGVAAWADEWWDMPITTGNVIAPLIGAASGEVTMHPNITLAEASILSCFEDRAARRDRTNIVSEEMNFPSVLYLLRNWSRTHDVELRLIPSDDGISIDLQRMIDAIDDHTLLVPISHVLFKSAFVQDVKAIVEKAHKVGALVVLDAYQSVGILPIDVKAINVDFLVGGVLKWLCGGPGGGFMYVRPDLRKQLKPRLTGWFAHRRPFDFDSGEIEYREDGFHFLNGTPGIPALYAATEGPTIIQVVGVEAIRAKSIRQTTLIIEMADKFGFNIHSPRSVDQRGGTVTID